MDEHLHFIQLIREVEGESIPWMIVFDRHRRIVDEGPTEEVRKRRTPHAGVPVRGRDLVPTSAMMQRAHVEALKARGIEAEAKGDSVVVKRKLPQLEREIAQFFVETMDCPQLFPGVEKLREEYFKEVKEAQDKLCTPCELIAISRNYRKIIDARLAALEA